MKKFFGGLVLAMLVTFGVGLFCRQFVQNNSQQIVIPIMAAPAQVIHQSGSCPYVPVAQRELPTPPSRQARYWLGVIGAFVVLWAVMVFRPWQKDEALRIEH